METKHTKGEWKSDHYSVWAELKEEFIEGNIVCLAPEHAEKSMLKWEANAKLIAAAPDLLDACLVLLKSQFPNYKTIDNSKHPANIAFKAIEKATK